MRGKPMPTEAQSRVLRMIAAAGGAMMLSYDNERETRRYHDMAGRTIAAPTALILIRRGWLIPERDSMFDAEPQSYRVRTP